MRVCDADIGKGELLQSTVFPPCGHGGGGQMGQDLVLSCFLSPREGGWEEARQGKARCGKERRGVYGFQLENKTYGILTFSLTCP